MASHPHRHPQGLALQRRSGAAEAGRKLWLPVPAVTLAFAVWLLWSVVVARLPAAGFHFSINQLFWLAALPALSAATLRLFAAFAAPVVAGRAFRALVTASLLLPALALGFAVQDTTTPYEWMVVLALSCGLAGALDSNAERGHMGAAGVQLVVPMVIGVGLFSAFGGDPQATPRGPMWLQNAGYICVPFIAASALAAWFRADVAPAAAASVSQQAVIITRKHTWLMGWLVLGSFGSYVGLSAAVPLLMQHQLPHLDSLRFVWLGPLLGALMLPLGRWLADRHGPARVSAWSFVALALAAAAVPPCLPHAGQGGSLPGLLAAFGVLFAAAGLANGSTLRMIPGIFLGQRLHAAEPLPTAQARAVRQGRMEAAAVLGLVNAIGAYGGFFIPKALGTAIALTGSPAAAMQAFTVFYLSCVALTWWHCGRHRAQMPC